MTSLTAARLRELFDYAPDTGVFTRRVPCGGQPAGAIAGNDWKGYRCMSVDGCNHYAHRLAWLFVRGEWPVHTIDHINGNKSDNRIANLRDVPHAVNCQNVRRPNAKSKSGVLGVIAFGNRWRASIRRNGKTVHLGLFGTEAEAHSAYVAAKRELHEGCTL